MQQAEHPCRGITFSVARRFRKSLSSSEVKDDTSQYKQLIRQMITELEEVLDVLNTPVR